MSKLGNLLETGVFGSVLEAFLVLLTFKTSRDPDIAYGDIALKI
jgi:hypothetical protein